MGWKSDITEWANKHQQEPSVMENIAIRKGWEPSKYKASMKSNLFDFLTKWYTLSVKTLPKPATAKRRNPTPNNVEKYTKLSNGWRIWTFDSGDELFTTIASDGQSYKEFTDNDLPTAFQLHGSFVKMLRK